MIYVALLRGINVGGKNKIAMKSLKQTFEDIGMKEVVTYINSGNIIFSDDQYTNEEIIHRIEEAIWRDFHLEIKVLVRSFDEMKEVVAAIPDSWTNDKEMKSDVLFLWDEIDNPTVLKQIKFKPDFETVQYIPGTLLWSVNRDNAAKSSLVKIVGTKLYKQMTIRNVNTTRKIYEIMKSI